MIEKIKPLIEAATVAEKAGALEHRNEYALQLFKKVRKVEHEGRAVETWWDRSTQSYVTQVHDADGREVSADYSGHKSDAAVMHLWALRDLCQPKPNQ